MNDYAPTTEDIETGFARYADLTDQASEARAKTGFQKWLGEVQADAWRSGYADAIYNLSNPGKPRRNPYQEEK